MLRAVCFLATYRHCCTTEYISRFYRRDMTCYFSLTHTLPVSLHKRISFQTFEDWLSSVEHRFWHNLDIGNSTFSTHLFTSTAIVQTDNFKIHLTYSAMRATLNTLPFKVPFQTKGIASWKSIHIWELKPSFKVMYAMLQKGSMYCWKVIREHN